MSLIRFKARALIGTAAIIDGVDVLRQPGPHEAVAASALEALSKATGQDISVKPATAVRASGIGQSVGGAMIATSIAPRLGALASLAATVPAALLGYRFWTVRDNDDLRGRLKAGFIFHLLLVGADLLVLAGPGRKKNRPDKRSKTAKGA